MFLIYFAGKKYITIEPDEIFIDSKNLPKFDLPISPAGKPVSRRIIIAVGGAIIALIYIGNLELASYKRRCRSPKPIACVTCLSFRTRHNLRPNGEPLAGMKAKAPTASCHCVAIVSFPA